MSAQNPPVFIQAGSHPAEDVRRFIGALVDTRGKGIVAPGDMAVTENGTPNMTVNVAGGRAFIPGTQATYQGTYLVENRGTLNLAIAAADGTNARKDLVVAKVEDAAYSGATNTWSLAVVTGTPAASPAEPAVPNNAIVLAMIDVPALDTAITNSQITDRRTSTSGQGRVTALGGVVVCTSTNRPTGTEGLVIYETDTDAVKVYDGSSWLDPKNLLSLANSSDYGKAVRHGVLTITTTVAAEASGNVSFSALSSTPTVVATVSSTLNQTVRITSRATTGFTITIAKRDGTNYAAGSQDVSWIAIG